MPDITTVEDWMRSKTKGHSFKATGATHNQNLVGRLSQDLQLKSGSKIYEVDQGIEYCIFRALSAKNHGLTTAATFYVGADELLSILSDGSIKRRVIRSAKF